MNMSRTPMPKSGFNKYGKQPRNTSGELLTQPFIVPRLLKWIPETPGDLEVKMKLSPYSGSATLRKFNPINKKGT